MGKVERIEPRATAGSSPKSRRVARCTKGDLKRAIEVVQSKGLNITQVRIDPDGSIHVITGTPQSVPSSNPWDGSEL